MVLSQNIGGVHVQDVENMAIDELEARGIVWGPDGYDFIAFIMPTAPGGVVKDVKTGAPFGGAYGMMPGWLTVFNEGSATLI